MTDRAVEPRRIASCLALKQADRSHELWLPDLEV